MLVLEPAPEREFERLGIIGTHAGDKLPVAALSSLGFQPGQHGSAYTAATMSALDPDPEVNSLGGYERRRGKGADRDRLAVAMGDISVAQCP